MSGRAAIGHVGLTVASLERSLDFYRDAIGMEELDRHEFSEPSFGELTGNPGARIRTALLRAQHLVLQLVEYVDGGGDSLRLDHCRVGTPHFSFAVEDVEASFEKMVANEVEVTSEIVAITDRIRSFYVADPDGVPVELMEGLYP
ncbi:MAG: VOC family protein [Deltaproteobacteria bacterium]|nr:VOC family protein [Deltaproteobacteria bacterium]MBW2362413.1 VOC family protein [Deltaproteobacteria bacterium]